MSKVIDVSDQQMAVMRSVSGEIARRFHRIYRGEPVEDFKQVALIGCLHAHQTWRSDGGSNYKTWLKTNATGECEHHVRNWYFVRGALVLKGPRKDAAPDTQPSYVGYMEPSWYGLSQTWDSPSDETLSLVPEPLQYNEPGYERLEQQEAIREALQQRPPLARRALAYYWFTNSTQTEIAKTLGVSQKHVSRLIRKTFKGLKNESLTTLVNSSKKRRALKGV